MIKFKVGNKIIERGKVYKVFKITKAKFDDKLERVIHYRYYFENSADRSIVCSIPECSIEHPDIRKPVSRKEIDAMLEFLSKRTRNQDDLDIAEAKSELYLNDILKTAEIIKRCFKEKRSKGQEFSKTKKDLLKAATESIVEEVALVHSVSLNSAKEKITIALDGS